MKDMSEPAENSTVGYEVTSHAPGDLVDRDLGACIAIIQHGHAVNPESADDELGRSEVNRDRS